MAGVGNKDGTVEGAVAGRVWGTYLHGPVLARNPKLADLLLSWVVGPLGRLDDSEPDALHARTRRLRADRAAPRRLNKWPPVEMAEMSSPKTWGPATTAFFTDRYELTMLEAALRSGRAASPATFEVFTRRLPDRRPWGVFAGLGRLVAAIEEFRFGPARAGLAGAAHGGQGPDAGMAFEVPIWRRHRGIS